MYHCIIFWSRFPIEFEIGIAFGIHVHTVKKDLNSLQFKSSLHKLLFKINQERDHT